MTLFQPQPSDALRLLEALGPSAPADFWRGLTMALQEPKLRSLPEVFASVHASLTSFAENCSRLARVLGQLPDIATVLENSIRLSNGPEELILVRHGYSERQLFAERLDKGVITKEESERFLSMPDSRFHLTDSGIEQIKAAAKWLASDRGPLNFEGIYSSPYTRAIESAGIFMQALSLDTPCFQEPSLSERRWGDHLARSYEERQAEIKQLKSDPRSHPVSGGESLLATKGRAHDVLNDIFRRHSSGRVVAFSHDEFIATVGDIMEHLSEEQLRARLDTGMPNGGIIIYSRRNPNTGELGKFYDWKRKMCPWDVNWGDGSWNGQWTKVERRTYSAQELLDAAVRQPRFYTGSEHSKE